MRVAIVGTGRMGGAMAGRVAAAGHDLVVFNRTVARAEEVAARSGAQVEGTAREAAHGAEVCLVSLADDASVRATYSGEDGIMAGLAPGSVVCDTSTVSPSTVRELAPEVAAVGATLLDTPVSGSVSVVEAGNITVMAGGPVEALARARPVLESFAPTTFHLGDVGAGATMKLVINSLVHSLNVALSESLVLAERAGLGRQAAYDVLEAGATGAPFLRYKRDAYLRPEEASVAFTLELVQKDQALIHALATEVGARMDQTEAGRSLISEIVRADLAAQDLSAVAVYLRSQA